MKQLAILFTITLLGGTAFAQRSHQRHALPVGTIQENDLYRTATVGDTVTMSNIPGSATTVLYSAGVDSGYLTGMNYWGDQAFAERYDVNGEDSTVQVIGVMALFGGKVNAAANDSVTFTIWGVGPQQYIASTLLYSGFPAGVLTTQNVPVTQLGIGPSDTMKAFMFDSATAYLSGSFFAGYSINYNFATLQGDTIGLLASLNGDRLSLPYVVLQTITDIDTVYDTVINVQNATQWSDNNWYDNYSQNDSLYNDLAIYPIVAVGNAASGIKGVTRHNLTFYGNFPNPATDRTNIQFSLSAAASVSVQIMDMAGRVLNTIRENYMATGMHTVPVNTSGMPAGNYLYMVRTSLGDGMAGKMTVIK